MRAVAHVLHAQGAGNHQHFGQCAAVFGGQNHAAHAGVERQAGQLVAHVGQLQPLGGGTQLLQQRITVGKRPAAGRLDEREVFHPAAVTMQVQGFHAQDDACQRAAQNFRVGEFGAASKALFVVQADANAVGHPAAAPCPLVGGCLADGLDQQLLHLLAQAVALDPRRAHVDHVAYARHSQRGFGHVRGQHDAPLAFGVKHPLLLGLAQAGKQRQHLGIAQCGLVAQVFGQVVSRFADFTLTRQEHQDVAPRPCAAAPQLVHGIGHGVIQVFGLSTLLLRRFFAIVFCTTLRIVERAVTYFNRKRAARHHQHGRGLALGICKVVGKPVRINGG